MTREFTILYVASMSKSPDRDSQWVQALSEAGFCAQSFALDDHLNYLEEIIGRLERRLRFGRPIKQVRRLLLNQIETHRLDRVHF